MRHLLIAVAACLLAEEVGQLPKLRKDGKYVLLTLGRDRKCATEYDAAKALGGVEGRKKLEELTRYDCLLITDAGTHVRVLKTEAGYSHVVIVTEDGEGGDGWIRSTLIEPVTISPSKTSRKGRN